MKEQLTAVFQKVPEGYIAFVEELPGANAQGDTLEQARSKLHSVYVNRKSGKVSTVPRHREINEFLAQKICRDLEIPKP
jgi:hypothetical protein